MSKQSKSKRFVRILSYISLFIMTSVYADMTLASPDFSFKEFYKSIKNSISGRHDTAKQQTNGDEHNEVAAPAGNDSESSPGAVHTTNTTEPYEVATRPVNSGGNCETEVAASNEDILFVRNERYKVVDGNAYKCQNGKWVFDKSLREDRFKDIGFRKTAEGCEAYNTKTGKKQNIGGTTDFSSGFEAQAFLDLFDKKGWSITTLLSPKADSVKKYMDLNKKIMAGGDFLDNRIDLEKNNVHTGKQALKFYAVKPSSAMKSRNNPSKSLIEKKPLCFAKGDDIWFSGWYYVEKGMPSTIVDFETRLFKGGPGIRLYIRDGKYASMELKFADKPQYNQRSVVIPRQQWVHIKLHLKLSNRNDGVIELWQDGKKILSTTGRTLPTHDTVYNAMQVGITATSHETVLLVDDVRISDQPI